MTDPSTIYVDEFLPHPPPTVWRALVDPDLLARWMLPNDFAPVVGHKFTFQAEPVAQTNFDGRIVCEVLDLRAGELLRISWQDASGATDTVVTWTLRPEGHGTRLFLEHSGFDLDDPNQALARKIMGGGWSGHVFARLRAALDGARQA